MKLRESVVQIQFIAGGILLGSAIGAWNAFAFVGGAAIIASAVITGFLLLCDSDDRPA